ncbi:MAG: hypothetical protein P4N60_11190 [Verrucomicrobiae bacterium]|nr:hypothetical protein [Verrucomicrobiae bacterium]
MSRTIDLGDSSTADFKRLQFFQALFKDQRGANPVLLTDFERGFFASWCNSSRPSLWFTPGRRPIVDQMWARYGGEINHPHPNDLVTERPKIADADPGCCMYIVKDESRQQHRCNDPATCREPGGLDYCAAHGEHVKRAVKGIALVPIFTEANKGNGGRL